MPQELPILFIGLGSTGAKLASGIRSNFLSKRESGILSERQFQFCRFLNVTSETSHEEGVDTHIPHFAFSERGLTTDDIYANHSPGSLEVAEFVKNAFQTWFPHDQIDKPESLKISNPTTGAGGMRIGGRLLLSGSFFGRRDLTAVIRNEINAIAETKSKLPMEQRDEVSGNIVTVVLATLAGGTAGGTFHDLPILVHRAFHESGVPTGFDSIHSVGAFLLADIWRINRSVAKGQKLTQNINQALTLAEIAVVNSTAGWNQIRKDWHQQWGTKDANTALPEEPPYSRLYFCGAKSQSGQKLEAPESYKRFFVDWWSNLLGTTSSMADLLPRLVDEGPVAQKDEHRTKALCNMGMMRIKGPREQVESMLRVEIANKFRAATMETVDENRRKEAMQQFKAKAGIDSPNTWFAIDDLVFQGIAEEEISNQEHLREEVARVVDNFKQFAATWCNRTSERFKSELEDCFNKGRTELNNIIESLLGAEDVSDASFATMKCFLEDLQDELRESLNTLWQKTNEKEQRLFGTESGFEPQVANLVNEARFTGIFRKKFLGAQDLKANLEMNAKELRLLALQMLCTSYFEQLDKEIQVLNLSRRFLKGRAGAKRANEKFVSQEHDLNDRIKKDDNPNEEILFQNADELRQCFIEPYLNRRETEDGITLAEKAATAVASNWANAVASNWANSEGDYESFRTVFHKLHTLYRQQGPTAVEEMQQNREAVGLVENAAEHLENAIRKAVSDVFKELLDDLTAWGGLRIYTENVRKQNTKRSSEEIVRAVLKAAAENLSAFPHVDSKDTPDERKVYMIHSRQSMDNCFEALSIQDGASLLSGALDKQNDDLHHHDLPQTADIVVLQTEKGINPFRISGEIDYRQILKDPEEASSITDQWQFQWIDRRFPEWIKNWHKNYREKAENIPDLDS